MADNQIDTYNKLLQTGEKLKESIHTLLIRINESPIDDEKKRPLYDQLYVIFERITTSAQSMCETKELLEAFERYDKR